LLLIDKPLVSGEREGPDVEVRNKRIYYTTIEGRHVILHDNTLSRSIWTPDSPKDTKLLSDEKRIAGGIIARQEKDIQDVV
jgi:hypothetical protein